MIAKDIVCLFAWTPFVLAPSLVARLAAGCIAAWLPGGLVAWLPAGLPACPPVGWPADRLACPPGLSAWPARWPAGGPACRPASQPSACLPVGLHASWLGCRPAGPLACWPGCLAACLPGCLLSQSTSSQHPVNIQSTSSQHPVNMRRETNETINIFYTAEEQAGVAIPASLIYY